MSDFKSRDFTQNHGDLFDTRFRMTQNGPSPFHGRKIFVKRKVWTMKIRSGAKTFLLVTSLITLGLCFIISNSVIARKARGTDEIDTNAGRIAQAEWSDDGRFLNFSNGDTRYRFDVEKKTRTNLGQADRKASRDSSRRFGNRQRRRETRSGSRQIPRPGRGRQYMTEPSPDGKWYALCKDWNVVLENASTGEMIAVTTDGHRKFRYGTANWVYGEELNVRHGMWWSRDSLRIVFYEFDERPVKDYYLTTGLTGFNTDLDVEGYMKAGAPNPIVTLKIYDLETGETLSVETGDGDQYLFDMRLSPDGSELLFHRTDRRQKKLDVMALDPKTGAARIVVTEVQETWQDNSPLMRFLEDGQRFIWQTEKTGWRQYELRHIDGSSICTLTRGEYPVSSIIEVDEKEGWLYYYAYSDSHPLCAQAHRVRLDGSGQKRLTTRSFYHSRFSASPDKKWFTVQYENVETPPSTALCTMEGELFSVLAEGPHVENNLTELFSFKAGDGKTDIYGVLHKPEDFDPRKKYPLIVAVYGGPGSRVVRNTYQSGTRDTRRGYLGARIDNRGTAGRGKAFKGAVYGKLGDVDIQDQADGVRYLRQRSYIDGKCVGIYGHSYGGFMAAIGILRHPDAFQAAVVRSAVTDWRHYDSIYTERYMNLPQDNPDGYANGSSMTYADKFEGKMLIMHGLLDNNVHPTNAWQLINALDKAGKKYESRFFPTAGHGTGGTDTQWEFFDRHLKGS